MSITYILESLKTSLWRRSRQRTIGDQGSLGLELAQTQWRLRFDRRAWVVFVSGKMENSVPVRFGPLKSSQISLKDSEVPGPAHYSVKQKANNRPLVAEANRLFALNEAFAGVLVVLFFVANSLVE